MANERTLSYCVETASGAKLAGSVGADGVVHVRVPLKNATLKKVTAEVALPAADGVRVRVLKSLK